MNRPTTQEFRDTESRRRDFDDRLRAHGTDALQRARATTVQLNVGKLCNQACLHCHVEAGPKRTEVMTGEVAERVLELLAVSDHVETLDITGGAPELNPSFRDLVVGARELGLHVIDRCNLTVLSEPGQDDLAEFLAQHDVEVVASMPCYGPDNVDAQRGKGVFGRSIDALQRLNALGYGRGDGLVLNLVYNPLGASLPPAQAGLEAAYKQRLADDFGVIFDHLFTLTNMPIARFLHALERANQLETYMALLVQAFNPATVEALMCRHQISIGWTGGLYDCDFNQMLELGSPRSGRHRATTIFELDSFDELADRPIATDAHCFGCTAGAGSSCGGSLE